MLNHVSLVLLSVHSSSTEFGVTATTDSPVGAAGLRDVTQLEVAPVRAKLWLFGNLRGSHLTDKNNFNFNVL